MVRNEPRKQEVRQVTRMSPEEPEGRLQAAEKVAVRVHESPERAAQLAEQKVLADLAARLPGRRATPKTRRRKFF
jgi:hypothetical protein